MNYNVFLPSVLNNELSDKKVHRDLKLIIFIMLALILIVWKPRWLYAKYLKVKKKIENDKYALCKCFFIFFFYFYYYLLFIFFFFSAIILIKLLWQNVIFFFFYHY